ncbi:MAG: phosphatidate cytidylyltransferase, partial [Bacillota bacterium]|nr:phosphatidate cytidylyltransferase [Bacillota bacterium]
SKAFNQEIIKTGYFLNFILNTVLFMFALSNSNSFVILTLVLYMIGNLIFYTFLNIKLENIVINLLGGFYISFFMYHLFLLNDTLFVWYIYIIAFGNDTFAYFTGKLFGKHKLSPVLSPKKTVEGAVGGIVGSIIIAIIFNNFIGNYNMIWIILFTATASIFSISGDLVASKIKRQNNKKDYSNFLPGHGGFLDRFDSVILVSPIIYYFSILIS